MTEFQVADHWQGELEWFQCQLCRPSWAGSESSFRTEWTDQCPSIRMRAVCELLAYEQAEERTRRLVKISGYGLGRV